MIKIIAIGKIKEEYLKDLINDYLTRIKKYHKIEVIELKDSDILSEKEEIKKCLKETEYNIILDIKGNTLNTIEFKEKIESLFLNGHSNITFIIGGSDGLHEEIKKLSDYSISFSKLTFPHGLFRGILLEQIYRIFKIMNNEKYHK